MKADERLFHEGRIKIPYRWPAGHVGSAFLRTLRDEQRFVATRCPQCSAVYCPPRSLCLSCYVPLSDLIPVGPQGSVVAAANGLGLIRLDGATTALLHRTSGTRGTRVAPLWAAARSASILDVVSFEPVASGGTLAYGLPVRPGRAGPRLSNEVAVLAAAITPPQADRRDWSVAEMVHEVVSEVLATSGLDYADVDTMVSASSDFLDGRTISDMAIQDVIGAPGHSASKVSMDGLFALLYAVARLNSGAFDVALVVAHGKASEGDPRAISQASQDPIFIRPLGVTDHDLLRLQADRYAPGQPVDLTPDGDGAVAVLLASQPAAKHHGGRHVWLTGAGFMAQPQSPGERDLGSIEALQHAVRSAGVEAARTTVAEVMALSSVQADMWTRALGHTAAHAPAHQAGFATGLQGLARVFHRLKADGGEGVAHAVAGYTGQNHAVWRLRA